MIANIVIKNVEFEISLVMEKSQRQTFLDKTAKPSVIKGAGNNMTDANEGVRYNNIIATYLHGPILPKTRKSQIFLLAKH